MDERLGTPTPQLFEVGQRPPLFAYLSEAWTRRRFAATLAGYRLVGSLLRNRLGVLWIVLKPLSMALIYGAIFGLLLSSSARPPDFIPYLLVGVFIFEFFTGCIGNGSKSITSNAKLAQSIGFPRILLPVSVVIEQAMRLAPILVLLGVLLIIFGVPLSWSWLFVIPILLMMAVFNLGVALIVARLSVWVRDVQQLVPIINRVLFYASGIFFQLDIVLADQPVLLGIAHMVPTYDFIALVREALLQDHTLPALAAIMAPIWTVLAIVVGVIYFWRAEARYGLSD